MTERLNNSSIKHTAGQVRRVLGSDPDTLLGVVW